MTRVITFASGKGGVGKTTITANIGIAFAQMGFKVCLIDADIAMANLSLLLGMQSSPITLHDVLLGEASINDALYDGPVGVKFVPSGLSLENYRRVDSERLESVVIALKDQFDFVLLDAPAGIEKNVLAAIAAAEEIILITMPESPSIADVLKTKMVAERLGSKPIGVIVNFVYGEKGEIPVHDIMRMLELPSYGTIPFDQEVRKSFMQEKVQPVILRAPNAIASRALRSVAGRIAGVQLKEPAKEPGGLAKLFKSLGSIFKRKKK
ncbi:cell division ATPase MinD [Candidatus Micrarchaeota archaeon]|nr:cell division ATPase MinD [Candidatus Micrarchaeota archaeon]MBU1931026.1 cell division ATPase MinD [Candidatus Micrarchaeota archaeon]